MASKTQWAIIAIISVIIGLGIAPVSEPARVLGATIGAVLVVAYVTEFYNKNIGPHLTDTDDTTN